jgi:hypothetical protein
VHTTGEFTLQQSSKIQGVLICEGSATCAGQITLMHDPQLVAAPPQGYTTYGTPVIVPGSWRQTVAIGEEAPADVSQDVAPAPPQ